MNVIEQISNSIEERLSKSRLMRRYSTQQNVNTKRKRGSKLILNTPKINDKNQKLEFEILFGLTHHSTKQYPQM